MLGEAEGNQRSQVLPKRLMVPFVPATKMQTAEKKHLKIHVMLRDEINEHNLSLNFHTSAKEMAEKQPRGTLNSHEPKL